MRNRLGLLGPDVDTGLIADQSMFVDTEDGRAELSAFVDRAFDAVERLGQHASRRARRRSTCSSRR